LAAFLVVGLLTASPDVLITNAHQGKLAEDRQARRGKVSASGPAAGAMTFFSQTKYWWLN
jgi:hypothetical protein